MTGTECWFWEDEARGTMCRYPARRVIEVDSRLIPCCRVHDPGTARAMTPDDFETMLVSEVMES